jgi:hypothetical protein
VSLKPLDDRQLLDAGLAFDKMADAGERGKLAAELVHLRAFAARCRHERSRLPPRLQTALDDHVGRPIEYGPDLPVDRPELELEP